MAFLIITLALTLRIYHYHHILTSDEANNMLTIKSLIEGEGIRDYFFKHPPLFTILSTVLSYPFGDSVHLVQGISIIFSVFSFIPFYLIVKKIFNERTALLSIFFLAVIPVNIIYSTWVKQDAMLLFFFLWSLYLYITGRYIKSGVIFGIAALTKEFALFLLPVTAGWELIKGWEGKEIVRRFLSWLSVGALITGWWYLFCGLQSFTGIDDAIRGGNLFEYGWHYPWYYYVLSLQADLSLPLLPFFIIGLFYARKGRRLLPIMWILAFYLPLSLIRVKAPWYVYIASPGLAVLTAVGFDYVMEIVVTRLLKLFIIGIVAGLLFFGLFRLNAGRYYEDQLWLEKSLPFFHEEEYLEIGRDILKKGTEKVAVLHYNPALQYYLGISDDRIYYLGPQFPAMNKFMLIRLVQEQRIGWFVIDTNSVNYLYKNVEDLISLWGEPKKIENLMIFTVNYGTF